MSGPLTRADMIRLLAADWPTIERDLRDASRNGLAAAAKLAAGRCWHQERALAWARAHGKLQAPDRQVVIDNWACPRAFPPPPIQAISARLKNSR